MSGIADTGAMRALTLKLDDELFAIAAGSVREILDLVPITEVPNAPAFVGGLINVRGRVVPLADLRVTFDMSRPPPDADTRIVVVEVDIDGEPTVAGILADKVHDVTDIDAAMIQEAPRVGMRWPAEFVRGIGKRNGAFEWSLSRDIADPSVWTERYLCPTWGDYLRLRSRLTQSDQELQDNAISYVRPWAERRVRRRLERPFGSVRWRADTPDPRDEPMVAYTP